MAERLLESSGHSLYSLPEEEPSNSINRLTLATSGRACSPQRAATACSSGSRRAARTGAPPRWPTSSAWAAPIPALAAPDKNAPPAQPVTKLTTSPSVVEDESDVGGEDDAEYWIGNDVDEQDERDNTVRDREPLRNTPIADRPQVQPLPSGVRPAAGGAGRR